MRVLLTGASGRLGAYLLPALLEAGHEVIALSGTTAGESGGVDLVPVDLTSPPALDRALERFDADAVLHTAAIASTERVRAEPDRARWVNVTATAQVARWCRDHDRRLLFTSTDLVFDGRTGWYREEHAAAPVVEYGVQKLDAEQTTLAAGRSLVARLALLYGPARCDRPGFYDAAMARLQRGEPVACFADEYRTPLHYRAAASLLTALLGLEVTGRLHVGGISRLSRLDLMRREARAAGLDPELVRPARLAEAPAPEPRPADVSLDTGRLRTILPATLLPLLEPVG